MLQTFEKNGRVDRHLILGLITVPFALWGINS